MLDKLVSFGFQEVILCVGYKVFEVVKHVGYSYKNLKIKYSEEKEPLGTGGALLKAYHHIKTDSVLVLNGDSFLDIDLQDLLCWHFAKRSRASIVLKMMDDVKRYGSVQLDNTGKIISFREKYPSNEPGLINAGMYIFAKDLIAGIQENCMVSLEDAFLPALLKNNEPVYGYCSYGSFIDIGMPESYAKAEVFFDKQLLKGRNTTFYNPELDI